MKSYTIQLLEMVKGSKRAISYEGAAKKLKASNPQLKDTSNNTLVTKKVLEMLVERGQLKKNKTGNYKF
ncbi:MAG: hypothetical protein LPK26_18330 [Bacillaceae bacterium]|uniref:Transcriptional regulator n=1 Tax=Alkalihalobacterium chitinilyticum TaxID=2980103 RepID=A0ABT5VJI7_9BACI|nr:hypothetical protein [Alkalihalobacterium chitinilyticum]MDE5415616.1 hypothetical protein [Alkalihalobacterium chitinilyticum]MEB1809218.1 hypothetical protein [Bacillaceae bacterium]